MVIQTAVMEVVVVVMVMVMMVMVGPTSAWSLAAQHNYGMKAPEVVFLNECGASVMKTIEPTESLQVLVNASTSTAAECQLSLRVSVKDTGLAKYGIRVSGHLQVSKDDCHSSSLLLHDTDDDADEDAVLKTFCSSGPITYRTVEDVLLLSYTQREGGEAWEGAAINIVPEVACGGVVTRDTTITINSNFKAPYVCNWELMPGKGQRTKLTFEKFNLTVRKRKRCTTECLLFVPGNQMSHYCGMELLGKTQYLPGTELMSLRVTRDVSKFKCKVEFVPDTRKIDHLPSGVQ